MPCPVSREKAEHTCGLLTNSMFASSSRMGARPSSIIRSTRACASRTLEIAPSGDPNCELSPQGPIIPVPPSSSPYRPVGACGNNWPVSPDRHAKRKPPNQRVRRPLLFRWRLCSMATLEQHQAVLVGTKTRAQKPVPAIPTQCFKIIRAHSVLTYMHVIRPNGYTCVSVGTHMVLTAFSHSCNTCRFASSAH